MGEAGAPKVTIGLPVYNGERHLRSALDSILGQTFGDFELVMSDNRSTDATHEICEAYARDDPRIRYSRQPTNVGAQRNFAAVLAGARGEYFKWSGHDDVLAPAFLERCVERLDADPGVVLCATGIDVIDADGARIGPGPAPVLADAAAPHLRLRQFFDHPRAHQTIFGVIRRSALDVTGPMGHWFASDRELLMELVILGRFDRVDETLFFHREHLGRSDYAPSTARWWMPEHGARPPAAHWRHLARAGRILFTAPMPPVERARCVGEYGRRARARFPQWGPVLWREASGALRSAARRARRADSATSTDSRAASRDQDRSVT